MRVGLACALLSAITFGFSGAFASPLLDAGWSPAAVIVVRAFLGGLILAVPAAVALRGRWRLLRAEARMIAAYGFVAVAFTQFAFYSAVAHMDVGVSLLIEYAAPLLVLGWLWAHRGQRPSRVTLLGAAVAVAGLMLVLDLFSGAEVSVAGMTWAVLSMFGCAVYFVLSARPSTLPPTVLISGGMLVGGAALLAAGGLGVLELGATTEAVAFRGATVPFWLPLLGIGVLPTAVAYLLGVLAARRLGSRLASFVALLEVVSAVLIAWALLGEAPTPVQVAGGVGILAGVVLVKLGERAPAPLPTSRDELPLAA